MWFTTILLADFLTRFLIHDLQVEARLRQLEGRSLASDAAKPKGKQQPGAYSPAAAQAGGGALLAGSGAKAYNAAADVVPVSEGGDRGLGSKHRVWRAVLCCALCCADVAGSCLSFRGKRADL